MTLGIVFCLKVTTFLVGSNAAQRALLPAAQNFGWLLRLQPGLFAWDVSRGQRGGIFSADPDADRREAPGRALRGSVLRSQAGLRGWVQAVGSSPRGSWSRPPRVQQLVFILQAPCPPFCNHPHPATSLRTNTKPRMHFLWFRPGWSRRL